MKFSGHVTDRLAGKVHYILKIKAISRPGSGQVGRKSTLYRSNKSHFAAM